MNPCDADLFANLIGTQPSTGKLDDLLFALRLAGLALLAVFADDFCREVYWSFLTSRIDDFIYLALAATYLSGNLSGGWKLSATPHINSADFSFNGGDGLGMWIVIVSSYAQIELWK
jgi:hypothetical protein